MITRFKTDTTSFAHSFVLLVMIAGVLNIDFFEGDVANGHNDDRVLYRIELVFNAEPPAQSPVLSISEDLPCNDVEEDLILPSHFYATWFRSPLFVTQYTGQVNARPIYSSYNHTRLFNIPHQNSDEDEAFIFPADVA